MLFDLVTETHVMAPTAITSTAPVSTASRFAIDVFFQFQRRP